MPRSTNHAGPEEHPNFGSTTVLGIVAAFAYLGSWHSTTLIVKRQLREHTAILVFLKEVFQWVLDLENMVEILRVFYFIP